MNKKITKQTLSKFIDIFKEIKDIETSFLNNKYLNGNVELETLREKIWEMYYEYEDKEIVFEGNSLIDKFFLIKQDENKYFEFGNLNDTEIKNNTHSYTVKSSNGINTYESISIKKSDWNKFPHCIIEFKSDNEIINFIINKYN